MEYVAPILGGIAAVIAAMVPLLRLIHGWNIDDDDPPKADPVTLRLIELLEKERDER